ncbi:MAG: hypothetical protein ACK56K_06740 [Akkermansiaceae bacterium]
MTTPLQRITRLLNEGARFIVQLPGHMPIDVTPDVQALVDSIPRQRQAPPQIRIRVRRPECLTKPKQPGQVIDLSKLPYATQ